MSTCKHIEIFFHACLVNDNFNSDQKTLIYYSKDYLLSTEICFQTKNICLTRDLLALLRDTAILIIIDACYHDFNSFPVVNWY